MTYELYMPYGSFMSLVDMGISAIPSISAHNHIKTQEMEMHYIVEGSGTFVNKGISYSFRPGQLFFSFPDETHEMLADKENSRKVVYWVQFHLDSSEQDLELKEILIDRFNQERSINIGNNFGLIFEDIRRRWGSKEPLIKRSADYRLKSLICELASKSEMHLSVTVQGYVNAALSLMQTGLGGKLDLDLLVAKLGIDKAYFIRIFKKAMGVPPMKYYLGLRIQAACSQLKDTPFNLRHIALSLGFRDEFHFSHQFKQVTGTTPTAYRRQIGV